MRCQSSATHCDETSGFANIEFGLWLIELQAASARLIGKVGSPYFRSGSMACPNHESQWALKSRMVLSSAWKGRTKAKKRSEEVSESPWKKTRTQAGRVCHLTSQWSGRLRAAHSGAAHRRVGRQIHKLVSVLSGKQLGISCWSIRNTMCFAICFMGGSRSCRERRREIAGRSKTCE